MILKHFIFVLLPTLIWSAFASGESVNPCEDEAKAPLSREVRAVVAVLGLALQARQVSLAELQVFAVSEEWQSPLRSSSRRPENLAFKQMFDRYARELSGQDKVSVKSLILDLIKREVEMETTVSKARDLTREIINIRLMPTTRSLGAIRMGSHSISLRRFGEYPVVGMKLKYVQRGTIQTYIEFPFPVPPRNLTSVTLGRNEVSARPPEFFESRGALYSFDMQGLRFQNVLSREDISAEQFGLKNSRDFLAEEYVVVSTSKGPKLFFSGHSDSTRFKEKLVMVDLENPDAEPQVLLHGYSGKFDEQVVGGRKFLVFQGPNKTVRVYDVERAFLYSPFAVEYGETNFSFKQTALFEDRGRLKLAIAAKEESGNRIHVYDVETRDVRKSRQTYVTDWGIHHFEQDGIPFIYFSTMDDLKIVNLHDMSVRNIAMPQIRTSATGAIRINGRVYIPGVQNGFAMLLVDVESPGNVFWGVLSDQSTESHLFKFKDKYYAIVADKADFPQIVEISTLDSGGGAK